MIHTASQVHQQRGSKQTRPTPPSNPIVHIHFTIDHRAVHASDRSLQSIHLYRLVLALGIILHGVLLLRGIQILFPDWVLLLPNRGLTWQS